MQSRTYAHYSEYPLDRWKWPNFSPQEMASKGDPEGVLDGGELLIDENAMDKLQALRDLLGRPLIVISAYRSPAHNVRVGGATNSEHLRGRAFDISMANHDPAIFDAAARHVGFTGFGYYRRNGFIHVDTGPARTWGEKWFETSRVTTYAATDGFLAPEPVRQPETAREDRDLIGTLVGGGGVAGAAGGVLTGLGALSPLTQFVVVAGLLVSMAALVYVFRNRIKQLAR